MSLFGNAWRLPGQRRLSAYLIALWTLARHPGTPRGAKWLAWGVLAYALSPIDLIPDFIPVLGQLDDIILIPLGVALVVKLVPGPLWQSCLLEAEARARRLPSLWWGALLVVLAWALLLALIVWGVARLVS